MTERTLTAANAVITLSIAGLFPVPIQLQGFAADDVTDISDQEVAEAVMGVDGILSGGYIATPIKQGITLQADSLSNDIFDQWNGAQQATRDIFRCQGVIILPGLSKKWNYNRGILTTYSPQPSIKKLTQPRKYAITWESGLPAPV